MSSVKSCRSRNGTIRVVTFAALLLFVRLSQATLLDWTFLGSGQWSTASNWQGNLLPGPTHDVRIGVSPTFFGIVDFTNVNTSILSLETNNPFRVNSGSLTLTSTTTHSWIRDSFEYNGGTVSLGAGSTLHLAGVTTWNSSSAVSLSLGSHLGNEVGGTIIVGAPASVTGAAGTFDNYGSIYRGGDPNSAFVIGSGFNNYGAMFAQNGSIQIAQSGTHSGLFDGTGGNIDFVGGAQTFLAGTQLVGNVTFHANSSFANSTIGGTASFESGVSTDISSGTNVQGTVLVKGGATARFNNGSAMNGGVVDLTASNSLAILKAGSNVSGGTVKVGTGGKATVESGVAGTASEVKLSGTSTVDGAGTLDTAKLVWSGGTVQVGTLRTAGGTVGGGITEYLASRLENTGTLDWVNGNADIDATGGQFVNQAPGVFRINSARSLYNGALTNLGVIRKTSLDTSYLSRPLNGGTPTFSNQGTVDVQNGTLEIDAGGTSNGTFTTAASALLIFNPSTLSPATLQGGSLSGNASFAGGTTVINGTNLNSSNLVLRSNSTLQVDSQSGAADSFTMTGGVLQGSGDFQTKALDWSVGIMQGAGKTIATESAQVHSDVLLTLNRDFENRGALTWSGAGSTLLAGGASTTLTNTQTGTWEIQGAQKLQNGTFLNNGLLRKTGTGNADLVTDLGGSFTNNGTVDVQGGALQIWKLGTHTGSFITSGNGIIRFFTLNAQQNTFASGSQLAGNIAFASGSHTIASGASVAGASLTLFDPVPNADSSVNLTIANGVSGTMNQLSVAAGILTGNGNVSTGNLVWNGGMLTGGGTLTTNGGTIGSGIYSKKLNKQLINASGVLNWSGGSKIELQSNGSIVNQAGATFNVSNGGELWDGTILNSGTIHKTGPGSTALNRNVNAGNDSFSNTGTVHVSGGGVLSLEAVNFAQFTLGTLTAGTYIVNAASQLRFWNANTLQTNAATITLDGAGSSIANQSGNNALAGLRTNQGTMNVLNGASVSVNVGAGQVVNSGVWNIIGGTVTIDDDIGNSGTMSIGNSGTMAVNGIYTQTGANAATIVNGTLTATGGVTLDGGVLRGTGNIGTSAVHTAVRNNGGRVTAGDSVGTLTITGDYSQQLGGELFVELQSPSAFDHLHINGNVSLGGILNISRLNGFSMTPNLSMDIVTFTGSRSGKFSSVIGLSPGLKLFYLPNAIELRSLQGSGGSGGDGLMPEPSTWLAMLLGVSGALLKLRRRTFAASRRNP